MCWLSKLFTSSGVERPSPSDIVPELNIRYDESAGLVLISLGGLNIPFTKLPKVWIPSIPDTNSMDPAFDFGHNNILIAGADDSDHKKLLDFIKVGDIAVYRIPPDYNQPAVYYAIHRIIEIGSDEQGRFFMFKGDNNAIPDPYKVRDNELLWLCIGTIF